MPLHKVAKPAEVPVPLDGLDNQPANSFMASFTSIFKPWPKLMHSIVEVESADITRNTAPISEFPRKHEQSKPKISTGIPPSLQPGLQRMQNILPVRPIEAVARVKHPDLFFYPDHGVAGVRNFSLPDKDAMRDTRLCSSAPYLSTHQRAKPMQPIHELDSGNAISKKTSINPSAVIDAKRSVIKPHRAKHTYRQACDCESCCSHRDLHGHLSPCNCSKCLRQRRLAHRKQGYVDDDESYDCDCPRCTIYRGRNWHSMDCVCTRCKIWAEGYWQGLGRRRRGDQRRP